MTKCLKSLSVVAFILVASFLYAQIPATDDGYTASSSPTSNYGTQSQLNVIGSGVSSYIRFDLPRSSWSSRTPGSTRAAGTGAVGLDHRRVFSHAVFDASQGSTMKLTLTGDATSSTLVNAHAGQPLFLILCQDGSGNHSFAPPTNVNWNADPVQTANHCSAQGFIFDGITAYNFAPAAGFSLGGTISGLNASGLTLQLNGGATLSIGSAATSFLFPNTLPSGQAYSVTIAAQPTAQTCSINNGTGAINHTNVVNISVACSGRGGFTISGTVQGGSSSFTGDTIPVTLTFASGTETLNVSLTQTQFTFTTLLQNGQNYSVTSSAQSFQLPNGANGSVVCSAINVSGTIANSNVADVVLNCVTPP